MHLPYVQAFWKEDDGTLTLIEEYVQGETLTACMNRDPLKKEQKAEVIAGVLEALSFLHSAVPPVIHRDVKPDNIVIAENGNVFLVDYDAAKVYRSGQKKDTVLLGTEGIAAPEQYGFGQSDVRTDIYAVGMLIRELFPSDDTMEKIAEKATRMDPEDRYQSVEELLIAVQEALNGTRGNAAKSSDLQRDDTGSSGGKRIRKKKSRLGILVAVLIAVVGVQIVLAVVVYPRYARSVTEGIQEGSTGADAKAVSEPVKEAEQPDQETVPEGAQKDSSAETAEILAPEVVESGYTILDKKASYGIVLHNPNEEYALKNVYVEATVRGQTGQVLSSNYVRIRYIAAGDTISFGNAGQLHWENEKGKTVEINVRHDSGDSLLQENSGILYSGELLVSNVRFYDGYNARYTGDVENKSKEDLEEYCVTCIFRKNGKIIGGWDTFVDYLNAGEKKAFDYLDLSGISDYDDCEVHALQWNKSMVF